MDATKIIASVLVVVAVAAAAFGAFALSANKSAADAFAWRASGYNPTSLCDYKVVSRAAVPDKDGANVMRLRLAIPEDATPEATRNAVLDAMRTSAMGDKTVRSVIAFADWQDDPVKGEKFSALKGVWAPAGQAAAGKRVPYEVKFTETTRKRQHAAVAVPGNKPGSSFDSEDGTVSVAFGGG
jgi:hypothetical protein